MKTFEEVKAAVSEYRRESARLARRMERLECAAREARRAYENHSMANTSLNTLEWALKDAGVEL